MAILPTRERNFFGNEKDMNVDKIVKFYYSEYDAFIFRMR
jgi:hypothetical protein